MKVNLLGLGSATYVKWALGNFYQTAPTPIAVNKVLESHLAQDDAEAWLFWNLENPIPQQDFILSLLDQPVDVWHAGLKLGLGSLPKWIDFVSPAWMLNCNPALEIEATSWRLSLHACLVRSSVLEDLGSMMPEFDTLEAAGLEMGHRWMTSGAIMRHLPELISSKPAFSSLSISTADELRFIYHRYEKRWLIWAIFRAIFTGENISGVTLFYWMKLLMRPKPFHPQSYTDQTSSIQTKETLRHRVSVIIPTLGRYVYLQKLLLQICHQTINPYEVIIIDQNPLMERIEIAFEEYPQLHIKMIFQSKQGQCTARNAGLQQATGDYILFVDDDDEIPKDLIQRHLMTLEKYQCDASCGVANEVGAGPLPANFTFFRVSDVFPTNNTLIKKSALALSGLFDLAYDQGQLEDGDLGMRLYLSGARMILNPEISLLHHHAPIGGLRNHNARIYTYAFSRQSLTTRLLPSISEIYLTRRYFTPRQVREKIWISILGTFSIRGALWKKAVKFVLSLFALPYTIFQIRRRWSEVEKMMLQFPQIPIMPDLQNQ